ncbi:peptidase inhibitor family I36 [Krasilnikovia cinnamomea]|uniref:Peptidase inhibitor family I36 n=1 Tax=Krasilnikovia cinnamomea TaxID=349313 RepID=A0A4Q7ZDR0_9ACTN|nr:peptidase inhibitor family I36 protein [Krasilnikovia cinnamomea]RZU48832.1 peptidase inhibitor family I36 [Krasilnikovia cinnamomea]
MHTIPSRAALVLAGAAAVVGLGASGASAAPTHPGAATADSPLILGEHQSLSGQNWPFWVSNPRINPDDEATSLYNRSDVAWVLYADPNYTGRRYCITPGRRISDLDSQQWRFNDQITSVKRLSGTSCAGYPTF